MFYLGDRFISVSWSLNVEFMDSVERIREGIAEIVIVSFLIAVEGTKYCSRGYGSLMDILVNG